MGSIKRAAFAVGTVVGAALCSVPAQAQTGQPAPFLFDDFLLDNGGQPGENLNNFFQFDVTGGSVDLVGGNIPGAPLAPPANPLGRYVDLGGSTGNPGLFRTRLAIPVTSATSYTLNFDYRSDTAGQLNRASVLIGDQIFAFSSSTAEFTRFSRTFTFGPALSTVFVGFQGAEDDTDNSGVGIDRMEFGPTLIPGGGAVPEPATWAMLLVGFGAIGARLRRRPAERVRIA